ncbi:MAG: efflux RND transporter permease subunit [Spirochaetes bacterium]|jgi:multidrug efflux pump subunit AcrB|nr:efflux RND transporter permease subunit [Spirochaetota bacterium]
MKRIIEFFIDNSLFVNVLAAGIFIAGLMYMFSANREAFPKIDFDYLVISTIYPGATAEDVEKHVTIPVEDQLREIDGIEELHSNSLEARSVVVVKLDPDLDNKDKTINDIKNALDRTQDLPDDAEDPLVTELTTAQQPVLDIAVIKKDDIKNDADEFEIRKFAKILEDRILEISGTARVDRMGYRDREMIVEVNPRLLDDYHVAMNDIIMALARKNLNFPGGLIWENDEEILVRTIGEVSGSADISNILIRANDMGNWVRVGDVATVRDSFEEEKIINKSVGRRSVTLTILKKETADIITLVDAINREVDRFKKILPKEYELVINNDLSYFVKRRLDVLVSNGIQGFALVIISLILSYGWRISIFTALAIPFSMLLTFIWMAYAGVSINLMSMFGLIMALGMLVDNNIVVSDNIYRHLEEGWSLRDAVSKGSSEVMMPIAATILTTIASFAPLMFMTGIMGKFVWTLPAVVSIALLASWIESIFFLPPQIHDMQKRRKSAVSLAEEEGGTVFRRLRDGYVSLLRKVVARRYRFVAIITAVFILTVVFAALKVKFILFPAGGIERFTVKAEAPTGTRVEEMSEKLASIEKIIARLPKEELESFTSRAGIIQEDPNDPYTKRGSKYGIIIVYLTPEENRKRQADAIIDWVREKSVDLKGFEKLEFKYVRNGPPTGMPVSVTIKGNEFDVLKKIADEYRAYLTTIKGLKDIKDNFEEGKEEIRIHINDRTAALAGISVFDIAATVRSCYEGTIATKIKKTDEEIDIRVIFPKSLRNDLTSIGRIKIANRMGNLIPLQSIARLERSRGVSFITRKDWRRTITVTADIDEKAKDVTSVYVNRLLIKHFAGIEERFQGYTIDYAGEFKDTQESFANLNRSFLIAALAIYIILVALFKSLVHPVTIMGIIPLSFLAVVWVFFFHGLPLSFLAIMGVVGLAGVVVNNSIVYLDFINISRSGGMSPFDASIEAGAKRVRPILLSSLTTVLGLFPTAYGIGGNDPFLKPMALSMAWGLAFGTLITLFATPVLYNIFEDIRMFFFGKRESAPPQATIPVFEIESGAPPAAGAGPAPRRGRKR